MEKKELSLTSDQEKVLAEVISYAEKTIKSSDYSTKVTNPEYYTNKAALLRFCIGHEFKSDVITAKWKGWVDWRLTFKPEKISEDDEDIEKQMETGKLRWFKYDKEKRPCLYYKMRYHKPGLATAEQSVRYFIYMLERGLAEAEKLGTDKIVVVYDRRGYSKKNQDPAAMETMKKLVPMLQDYYPERLHIFYVLGANWFYRTMFDLVKLFLSKKTIEKVRVLADQSDLLEFFDKENLSIEYGGIPESSKFGKSISNQLVGVHGGDDGIKSESEDERELKKLADALYKQHGMKRPKLDYEADDDEDD